MARSRAGAALTAQHRQRQLALRAVTLRDLLRLWPIWTFGDVASYEAFVAATMTLVRSRNRDSAGLAASYYSAFRLAESVRGEATPRLVERPPAAQIIKAIDTTGRVGVMRALEAGLPLEAARRNGLVRVSGSVGRLVMNGGRHTLVQSTAADRYASGWQRITGGNPCGFCSDLAGRGAVYSEDTADFQAHDHCSCVAEPNYAFQ